MGIVAWLVARFGGASVVKIIEFIAVALIAFAFIGLLYGGVLHIERIGADKKAAELAPVMKKCADDKLAAEGQRDQALHANTDLGSKLKLQNKSIEDWQQKAAENAQRAQREMLARQAIQKLHNVKIAADAAVIAGPAATSKEQACADSAAITRGLVLDLVQQH